MQRWENLLNAWGSNLGCDSETNSKTEVVNEQYFYGMVHTLLIFVPNRKSSPLKLVEGEELWGSLRRALVSSAGPPRQRRGAGNKKIRTSGANQYKSLGGEHVKLRPRVPEKPTLLPG
ncbi:hypothetical protein TNCV_951601 [Trichonephila clavipes]|nr:hypothetical protein TNCV_951601 [Trichonephila clavipes]